MKPRFGILCVEIQAHPSHKFSHVQPVAHEPLQDVTLLVRNLKLSCILNMSHLLTNTAARLQPQHLCSRSVLHCIVV